MGKLAKVSDSNKRSATLQETLTALISEAHAQQRQSGAARLTDALTRDDKVDRAPYWSPMLPENVQSLLYEPTARRPIDDLVLAHEIREDVREFVSEYSKIELLRSHSLEPRHTILLIGPPGTGKTSLASALAHDLALPFLVVRYDGLVGSYLGETASRLQQIVDYVSRTPCVLFFDEFESVGKERSDAQETGEIKRVVSSLLLHMDAIPTQCVIICATNHPELLDRAVWRRFELRLELPLPGAAELREWFKRLVRKFGPIKLTPGDFARLLIGQSYSEVEAITLDARRKAVLSEGSLSFADAFGRAIDAWQRRKAVGGVVSSARRSNRSHKPRANKKQSTNGGAEAPLSESDLVQRAENEARK